MLCIGTLPDFKTIKGLSSLAIVKPVLPETPTCILYLKASLVKASQVSGEYPN
jgi:hypothetical protein